MNCQASKTTCGKHKQFTIDCNQLNIRENMNRRNLSNEINQGQHQQNSLISIKDAIDNASVCKSSCDDGDTMMMILVNKNDWKSNSGSDRECEGLHCQNKTKVCDKQKNNSNESNLINQNLMVASVNDESTNKQNREKEYLNLESMFVRSSLMKSRTNLQTGYNRYLSYSKIPKRRCNGGKTLPGIDKNVMIGDDSLLAAFEQQRQHQHQNQQQQRQLDEIQNHFRPLKPIDHFCTEEHIYHPLSTLLLTLYEKGCQTAGIFRKCPNYKHVDNLIRRLNIPTISSQYLNELADNDNCCSSSNNSIGNSDMKTEMSQEENDDIADNNDNINFLDEPHLAAAILKRMLQAGDCPFFPTSVCIQWIEACGHNVDKFNEQSKINKCNRAKKMFLHIQRNSLHESELTSFSADIISDIWSKRTSSSLHMHDIAKNAIEALSKPKQLFIKFLICLLSKIQLHKFETNMDYDGLAICISSVLFHNSQLKSLSTACIFSQSASSFISFLLRNSTDIFGLEVTNLIDKDRHKLKADYSPQLKSSILLSQKCKLYRHTSASIIAEACTCQDIQKIIRNNDEFMKYSKLNKDKNLNKSEVKSISKSESTSSTQSTRSMLFSQQWWTSKLFHTSHNARCESYESMRDDRTLIASSPVIVEGQTNSRFLNANLKKKTQRSLSDQITNKTYKKQYIDEKCTNCTNCNDCSKNDMSLHVIKDSMVNNVGSNRRGIMTWIKRVYSRSHSTTIDCEKQTEYIDTIMRASSSFVKPKYNKRKLNKHIYSVDNANRSNITHNLIFEMDEQKNRPLSLNNSRLQYVDNIKTKLVNPTTSMERIYSMKKICSIHNNSTLAENTDKNGPVISASCGCTIYKEQRPCKLNVHNPTILNRFEFGLASKQSSCYNPSKDRHSWHPCKYRTMLSDQIEINQLHRRLSAPNDVYLTTAFCMPESQSVEAVIPPIVYKHLLHSTMTSRKHHCYIFNANINNIAGKVNLSCTYEDHIFSNKSKHHCANDCAKSAHADKLIKSSLNEAVKASLMRQSTYNEKRSLLKPQLSSFRYSFNKSTKSKSFISSRPICVNRQNRQHASVAI